MRRGDFGWGIYRALVGWGVVVAVLVGAGGTQGQDTSTRSRAAELMKNRQYNDAIRVLKEEMAQKRPSRAGGSN